MNSSWANLGLLSAVTLLYAGYNVFVKVSGSQVPATATSTILATVCLQVTALFVSLVFFGILSFRGGHSFSLNGSTYWWAIVAGVCIGLAEIGYFYMFGGLNGSNPMNANTAIPVIVSGTIVIATVFSVIALKESVSWNQLAGGFLILAGILLFFIRPGATS